MAMTTMSFANATHTEFGSYVRQCSIDRAYLRLYFAAHIRRKQSGGRFASRSR